jgi:hypothetical protein
MPLQHREVMFSVLIPFFMGGNSLPGAQPAVSALGAAQGCSQSLWSERVRNQIA